MRETRLIPKSDSGVEAVANPGLREYVTGRTGIGLDLLPQLADEHAQVLGLFAVVCSPDCGEQFSMSQNFSRVPHKVGEQIEFLWRQMDFFSQHYYFSSF